MNRIVSFDYIRVISVFGIILCHCCYGITGLSFLGRFLANTFNFVFLILSAFLIGLSWDKHNCKALKKEFIIKRLCKLAYSYYPFIVIMFIFLIFTNYHITFKDIAMHVMFLPWFDKLPGFGHLWFITMIVFCYIGIYMFSNISRGFVKYCKNGGVILITALVSQIIIGRLGFPNYMFMYLLFYIYVFANAKKLLLLLRRVNIKIGLIIFFITFSIGILLFYNNLTNTYTSIWCGIFCAVIFLCLTYNLFKSNKTNNIISFISYISFEIYLVHHIFCFGQYSLYKYIPSPIIGTITIIIISISMGYLFKYIGCIIANSLKIKN